MGVTDPLQPCVQWHGRVLVRAAGAFTRQDPVYMSMPQLGADVALQLSCMQLHVLCGPFKEPLASMQDHGSKRPTMMTVCAAGRSACHISGNGWQLRLLPAQQHPDLVWARGVLVLQKRTLRCECQCMHTSLGMCDWSCIRC